MASQGRLRWRLVGGLLVAGGIIFFLWFPFGSPERASSLPSSQNKISQNQKEEGRGYMILMSEEGFSPQTLEIQKGESVRFENVASDERWPASNIHPTHQIYPEFDPQRPIRPAEKWSFVFSKPGRWRFHDHLYPRFTGEIIVRESESSGLQDKKTEDASKAKVLKPLGENSSPDLQAKFAMLNTLELAKDEKALRYWLSVLGPEKVMAGLLEDAAGGSLSDCHQESHTIGRIAYELYGASVFEKGDSSCHSGFYHGAMEAFLKEKGTANIGANIEEVCRVFPTSFGKFECLHGVGHGVLAYEDYDLPKALGTCAALNDGFSKTSCYGGTFMENIVTAQGLGAVPGHDTKWANTTPQFPCTAIDQDYEVQYQCYQMQTSWMLSLFDYDFGKVVEECVKVRSDMVSVCFKSLGRDAAGHSLRDPQKILEICEKVPKEANRHQMCVIGAVNVIVDFWGAKVGERASALCKLTPDVSKEACYSTLAGRLHELYNAKAERQEVCRTFEENYQNLCRE